MIARAAPTGGDERCGCGDGSKIPAKLLEIGLRDASVAINLVDRDRRTVWSNRATDSLLGMPPGRALEAIEDPRAGEDEWRFFDAEGRRCDILDAQDRCIERQERFGPTLIGVRRPDGSLFWADTEMIPVPACRCGSRWYAMVVSVDLTERRFAEQVLHRLAFSDPLTGLANRVVLEDRLARALRQKESRDVPSRLFYFDLDRFKPINDRFGHEAGDVVLREAGRRLEAAFRPGDTVARVGGDEFAVLAEGIDDGEQFVLRAREAVERPLTLELGKGAGQITIGISGGWAAVEAGESVRRLIHRADRAMYEDKRNRTNSAAANALANRPPR